jgi:hypothetical protein
MDLKGTVESVKERAVEALPERAKPWVPYLPLLYSVGGAVGGVVWSFLTASRIDDASTTLSLAVTLTLLGLFVVLESRIRNKRIGHAWIELKGERWAAFGVTFALSSLYNTVFVYYMTSASNLKFALFGLLILAGIGATRFVPDRLAGEHVRFVVLLVSVFSVFQFWIPLATGSFGAWTFFAASFLAFLATAFAFLLGELRPTEVYHRIRKIDDGGVGFFHWTHPLTIGIHGALWLGTILFLGFLHIAALIPPVPLALLDAGVFRDVERDHGQYVLSYEKPPLTAFWRTQDLPFRRRGSEDVYFFTALFAPTGTSLGLVHHWQRWDDERGWVTDFKHTIDVTGGREGGFRAYTRKRAPAEGLWRVIVETDRGREIGRRKFRVVRGEGEVVLRERVVD